jgi:hypothetical protein
MDKIDWRSLTASLGQMKEDDIKRLLDHEMARHKRSAIVRRLHQRYSALRTMRERAELMAQL